jgi:oligoribonuclease
MPVHPDNLVWLDLEMTGLDPDRDRILEIALVVTGPGLEVLAEGPEIAVHQGDEVLAGMDQWNTDQHGASGLVERVRLSAHDEGSAQRLSLDFLAEWVPAGASPICGNSICQDRRFLYRWMPELERYFHYRNLDVSTLKELCRRWAPEILEGLSKRSSHRALEDVHDSIEELRHYRRHFLRPEVPAGLETGP